VVPGVADRRGVAGDDAHRLGTLAISHARTRPQNPQPLRGGGGLERDGVGVGVPVGRVGTDRRGS
jgi:hypothetical protein